MSVDLENANKLVDEAIINFGRKIDALGEVEKRFVEESRKASGSVRDATSKMADGLARIERTANFDKLERYVLLLERAEAALSSLARLSESGALEKISGALK